MITLRKIIYDIRGLIRDARSDDLHFTDRQIAFWIKTLRARLLKERIDKGQKISDKNYQTIPNLPVTPESTITGVDVKDNCLILSTGELPDILEDKKGNPLISNIRGLNIYSKISFLPKVQAYRLQDNKYTKNMPVSFLENHKLYILGCGYYLENMTVEALFEDPDEANKLINGEPIGMDESYPIDANLLDLIKELIITKTLALYIQLPEDRVNDAETAY